MDFSLFQFEVDNANTVERGVALLTAKLSTHPSWVFQYLFMSQQSTVAKEFLYTFVCHATPQDIPMLRNLLEALPGCLTMRLFMASPYPEITQVLVEWQQGQSQSFGPDV